MTTRFGSVVIGLLPGMLVLFAAPRATAYAQAQRTVQTHERVVLTNGRSLFLVIEDTEALVRSVEIVRTDYDPIVRLQVSGTAVLFEKRASVAWARIGTEPLNGLVESHPLPCRAPARMSSSGDWVSCTDDNGGVRFIDTRAVTPTAVALAGPTRDRTRSLEFAGPDRGLAIMSSGLWSVSLTGQTRGPSDVLVFPAVPDAQLSVTPDGNRAVAWFAVSPRRTPEKLINALFTFRLDGKGDRRRLMKRAVPVAWSADSTWLLVQRGERACVVRARGGQYKCWRGYTAVDISAHGEQVLLTRDTGADEPELDRYKGGGIVAVAETPESGPDDASETGPNDADDPIVPAGGSNLVALEQGPRNLYVVTTAGAAPERPVLLLEAIDGPSAFLQAP